MTNTLNAFNPHVIRPHLPDIPSPKPVSGLCMRLYTTL